MKFGTSQPKFDSSRVRCGSNQAPTLFVTVRNKCGAVPLLLQRVLGNYAGEASHAALPPEPGSAKNLTLPF
jgi:hypothetical protein